MSTSLESWFNDDRYSTSDDVTIFSNTWVGSLFINRDIAHSWGLYHRWLDWWHITIVGQTDLTPAQEFRNLPNLSIISLWCIKQLLNLNLLKWHVRSRFVLVSWLVGWLVGSLGWLVGLLVYWFMIWLVGSLGRFTWLVGWLVHLVGYLYSW